MFKKYSTTTNKKTVEPSHWKGSVKTASLVKGQIAERWGEDEAEKYDPDMNCWTYNAWQALGYQVRKGEKALVSFTLKEGISGKGEDQKITKYPQKVFLFYYLQVDKKGGN